MPRTAKSIKFTVENLEKLRARCAAEGKRIEVGDSADAKLRARISGDSVRFICWRNEGGTRVRDSLGILGQDGFSLADARKRLALSLRRPTAVIARRRTFLDVATDYRKSVLASTKKGDATWKDIFERHLLPRFGHVLVKDLSPATIRTFILELSEKAVDRKTGRRVGGKGIARHALRSIRAVLKLALELQDVEFNAAAGLSAKSLKIAGKKKHRWLDEELMPLFLDSLGIDKVLAREELPMGSVSPQVRLALALLAYLPVRPNSLRLARVTEFHLDPVVGQPATWKIPAAHIKGGEVDQVLPLPETAVTMVRELVHLAGEAKSPFLLPSPETPKRPLAEKSLSQTFRRRERAGQIGDVEEEHLTLYSLRASWRSWALELGVPADIAEMCMGHKGGLQRLGFSEAAGRYTRSRALARQAAALNRVGRHMDGFWKPSGPGASVTDIGVRARA